MWTKEQRAIYWRDEDRYPSNLTDAEWERLKPLIPEALPGGRPRKTDMRAAMNAIFYLLRTGCPWRYLPRDEFPPRSTVYNIFRKFQKDGVWEAIWEELHMTLREQLGREASPTAAVIDSQTLKAAEKRLSWLSSGLPWGLGPKDCIEDAEEASHACDECDFLWASPFDQIFVMLADDGVPTSCG